MHRNYFWALMDIIATTGIDDATVFRAIIIDISQRKQSDEDVENLNRLLRQQVVRLELANEEMEASAIRFPTICGLPSVI